MKIAIYPGSFDPITNGHLDIIERAVHLFGKVIVTVALNSEKSSPLFSHDERMSLIAESVSGLENIEVDSFDGFPEWRNADKEIISIALYDKVTEQYFAFVKSNEIHDYKKDNTTVEDSQVVDKSINKMIKDVKAKQNEVDKIISQKQSKLSKIFQNSQSQQSFTDNINK